MSSMCQSCDKSLANKCAEMEIVKNCLEEANKIRNSSNNVKVPESIVEKWKKMSGDKLGIFSKNNIAKMYCNVMAADKWEETRQKVEKLINRSISEHDWFHVQEVLGWWK